MEFDKSRVYTSVNADELKVGSKVVSADSMFYLREFVEDGIVGVLDDIEPDNANKRFIVDGTHWNLVYFVSEPEEKKLKWTDLKIGDIIRKKYEDGYRFAMVVRIDTYSTEKHVGLGGEWPSDDELKEWEKVEN